MTPVRQTYLFRTVWLALGLLLAAGCSDSAMRLQSPEAIEEALEKILLVRDVSVPFGGHPLEVESVVLIGNLDGTGSDPPPSSERSVLITDMQKRDVHRPNQVMASPDTSLAMAKGYLPPGTQQGDRFDVEIYLPRDSETTSLRGGAMYETKLRERAVLGGQVREGKVLAFAKGPVLVDPMADPDSEPRKLRRGLVLGGGVARETRPLGLLLKPDVRDVRTSARIGAVINKRFFVSAGGIKSGVANPKTDGYVDLKLHPRYKDNIDRYIQVIRSIPLQESSGQQAIRLQLLQRQLTDPVTAAGAAIRLEAIGREAMDVLLAGLESGNSEVRFYAAESLAYLDQSEAAEPLAAAARDEPAFRAYALTALSAMDDPAARDALAGLLHVRSAETRYGAFRALWAMNRNDPLVRGEVLANQFSYHLVRSEGPAMVHVTRTYRPELVLFGPDERLTPPLILDAGKHIRVNATESGKVLVSRFAPGQSDRQIECSTKMDEIVRAIVDLGGTYPDVVQAFAQAKSTRSLVCRFEVDAVPRKGRIYHQETSPVVKQSEPAGFPVDSPDPDLYPIDAVGQDEPVGADPRDEAAEAQQEPENRWPVAGAVGKIFHRFRD